MIRSNSPSQRSCWSPAILIWAAASASIVAIVSSASRRASVTALAALASIAALIGALRVFTLLHAICAAAVIASRSLVASERTLSPSTRAASGLRGFHVPLDALGSKGDRPGRPGPAPVGTATGPSGLPRASATTAGRSGAGGSASAGGACTGPSIGASSGPAARSVSVVAVSGTGAASPGAGGPMGSGSKVDCRIAGFCTPAPSIRLSCRLSCVPPA